MRPRYPFPSSRVRLRGLTLVEVLVALAIGAVLLGLTANLLGSARAASAAQAGSTEPERALDLAAELLAEEIALAGFEPWRLASDVPEPAVSISRTTGGVAVTLAFVDDRLAGPALDRVLTFEAKEDGSGQPQLYRRSGDSTRQPLVEGITELEVVALVSASGDLVSAPSQGLHPEVRGLVLRLREENGRDRYAVVRTPSLPTVEVR